MPVSPARAAAFDILLKVEREDAYASELLHSSQYDKLFPADHRLATEIVMGVLRWRSVLDSELARFSSQKLDKLDAEVLTSLRTAAFQLVMLDRVPARAAVNESVELVKRARKRSAAPFVNALLRKLVGHTEWLHDFRKVGEELDEALKKEDTGPSATLVAKTQAEPEHRLKSFADRYSHPRWLVERWVRAYGWERLLSILRSNQEIPVTAIRLPAPADAASLQKSGVILVNGALLTHAARVDSGDLTRTEPFRAGRIAIQDEASQLVALLLGQGKTILDCCAAPGGKTRVIADRSPDAKIVALELHPHRARLLRRLVPAKNIHVICGDIRQSPVCGLFDRVLVDVPCSGTGTLQRNPEIKWRLRLEDLADLQSRQISILTSAMKHVAPQGKLVYSTCSLEPEENQEVVEKSLVMHRSFRIRDCRVELEQLREDGELAWNDIDSLLTGPFLRTIPGVPPCDGFFAAILERKD